MLKVDPRKVERRPDEFGKSRFGERDDGAEESLAIAQALPDRFQSDPFGWKTMTFSSVISSTA